MANFVFENMTQAQAAAFTSTDNLIFLNATAATLGVANNAANSLQVESFTLTSGNVSLTFNADALSTASLAGRLTFVNSDVLALSDSGNDAVSLVGATDDKGAAAYGFAGNDTLTGSIAFDTINGGAGNDVINGASDGLENDFLFGGAGADSITGSDTNDHIYGNALTSVQGAVDGNDTINAGIGNDYVNGNGGDDTINGQDGNDRLFGGAGNDVITGGLGNDSVNGNMGDDSILGNDGNDTLRGGAGNDTVDGGVGNDSILGDLGNDSLTGGDGNDVLDGGDGNDVLTGNIGDDLLVGGAGADTITGGTGFDALTGGAGVDRFVFAVGDAGIANVTASSGSGITETINDFAAGSDKIDLPGAANPGDVLYQATGVTFTAVQAAYTYAQQLMDATADTTDVAAIQVGADTYLFANAAGTGAAIDTVIKLTGVTASTVSETDFFN